jgi:glutamate/tyrosine decarboxylase-like PLP-dependent enzyme
LELENHKLQGDLTGLSQASAYYYASTDSVLPELATASIPETGNSARHCARMLKDHHNLDTNENLNTAGYINVYLEKEEFEVANIGLQINLADQTVYPESFRVHNIVLNMVARLWNCPTPPDFGDTSVYPGACTVGSTEACLLGGLCLRFRWREWYAKRHNLTPLQVKAVVPNLVISSLYQFFRPGRWRLMIGINPSSLPRSALGDGPRFGLGGCACS